jgi:hypothetical protein
MYRGIYPERGVGLCNVQKSTVDKTDPNSREGNSLFRNLLLRAWRKEEIR